MKQMNFACFRNSDGSTVLNTINNGGLQTYCQYDTSKNMFHCVRFDKESDPI